MKTVKTISIKCDTKDFIDWHNLSEFQGGLKTRDDADIQKAKTSILKFGWSFPFFVWASGKTNYVLDGHCRLLVLKALEEEGYIIPELPCVYIQAKNKAEAKQKLLRRQMQNQKQKVMMMHQKLKKLQFQNLVRCTNWAIQF